MDRRFDPVVGELRKKDGFDVNCCRTTLSAARHIFLINVIRTDLAASVGPVTSSSANRSVPRVRIQLPGVGRFGFGIDPNLVKWRVKRSVRCGSMDLIVDTGAVMVD